MTYMGGGIAPSFLPSTLYGVERAASPPPPGHFTPKERAPGTHRIVSRVGPKTDHDSVE
jgi:hypothetical protein